MRRMYKLKIFWKNPKNIKDALEIRKKEFGVEINSQIDPIIETIETLLDNHDILSKGLSAYDNIIHYIKELVEKYKKMMKNDFSPK